MLKLLPYFILLLSFTTGRAITGIFTSFDSLVWDNPDETDCPLMKCATAILYWKIDGYVAKPGDTFKLHMPGVSGFTTPKDSINLQDGVSTYATCELRPGEGILDYSELMCTLTSKVTDAIYVTGTVGIPIAFDQDFSENPDDQQPIENGFKEIMFSDGDINLTTNVKFQLDKRLWPLPLSQYKA